MNRITLLGTLNASFWSNVSLRSFLCNTSFGDSNEKSVLPKAGPGFIFVTSELELSIIDVVMPFLKTNKTHKSCFLRFHVLSSFEIAQDSKCCGLQDSLWTSVDPNSKLSPFFCLLVEGPHFSFPAVFHLWNTGLGNFLFENIRTGIVQVHMIFKIFHQSNVKLLLSTVVYRVFQSSFHVLKGRFFRLTKENGKSVERRFEYHYCWMTVWPDSGCGYNASLQMLLFTFSQRRWT